MRCDTLGWPGTPTGYGRPVPFEPRLIDVHVPERPSGAVLVLHGGAGRGTRAVSPTQLSVLRMVPIARRIAHIGGDELAVFRLLNSTRGWGQDRTPVDDARWALGEIRDRLGELPTCLVGHSLGGRSALFTADRPGVASVVALAPWVYPDDSPGGLHGRRVLVVHGDGDRIASPANAAKVTRRMRMSADAGFVTVRGAKHAMLGRGGPFTELAAEFAAVTLLGRKSDGAIARLEAGAASVEV